LRIARFSKRRLWPHGYCGPRGWEFASEIVVKASLLGAVGCGSADEFGLRMDGAGLRICAPWRDGWRHLRFCCSYSPRWLFLYPGIALMWQGRHWGCGCCPAARLGRVNVGRPPHWCMPRRLLAAGISADRFRLFLRKYLRFRRGCFLPMLRSISCSATSRSRWIGCGGGADYRGARRFGICGERVGSTALRPADYSRTMRIVIPAALCLTLGAQTIFASFFLSVLGMRRR